LWQQAQDSTVSDTTLLSGYRNLAKDYIGYIDANSTQRIIVNLKESIARFRRQMTIQASDTATITRQLESWRGFSKLQRVSPEKSYANKEIQRLESLTKTSTSIASEEKFVVCRNVVNRDPQRKSNRFSLGTIYAWAQVNAPRAESVTFKWYARDRLIHTHTLRVDRNEGDGYRVYTAKNYGEDLKGVNEVRLYNSEKHLIGRRVFSVGR
jgi:hypothetical protein